MAVKPDLGVAVPHAVYADVGRWGAHGGRALLSRHSLQCGLDSPVFLSFRGSRFDTVPPGVAIGSSVLPAGCVDVGCFEVALDGVFEAQQRSTGAVAQFSVENLSWQALRLHAVNMSKPAEASLNEHRGYARETGALKDLSVSDFVLPFDVQKASKRAEVEPIEASLLSGVGRPRLAAIEESRQDTGLVDAGLGPFAQQPVVPHSLVEFGYDPCSLSDSRADLGLERC